MGKKPGATSDDDQTQSGAADDQNEEQEQDSEEQTEDGSEGEEGDSEGGDEPPKKKTIFKSQEDAEKEVLRLRKENARQRLKNKELAKAQKKVKAAVGDDEEDAPEEQDDSLAAENAALKLELGVAELAAEHGIPKERRKYLKMLIAERCEDLEDGEELDPETLEEIIAEVQALGGGVKKGGSTGVNTKNQPDAKKKTGDVTVEQFAKMNTGEKSALYVSNPDLYNRLFSEANAKRLL